MIKLSIYSQLIFTFVSHKINLYQRLCLNDHKQKHILLQKIKIIWDKSNITAFYMLVIGLLILVRWFQCQVRIIYQKPKKNPNCIKVSVHEKLSRVIWPSTYLYRSKIWKKVGLKHITRKIEICCSKDGSTKSNRKLNFLLFFQSARWTVN